MALCNIISVLQFTQGLTPVLMQEPSKMFLLLENLSDPEPEVMCSYAEIIRDVQNFSFSRILWRSCA